MAFAVAGLVLPKRPSRISDLSEGAHLSQFTGAGPLPRGRERQVRKCEAATRTHHSGSLDHGEVYRHVAMRAVHGNVCVRSMARLSRHVCRDGLGAAGHHVKMEAETER